MNSTWSENLTDVERDAIHKWMGSYTSAIREVQLGNTTTVDYQDLERNFSTAIQKAPTCNATLYRGLSVGIIDRVSATAHLRMFIDGTSPIILPTHCSASLDISIGKGWTRIEESDQQRFLSVLLIITPLTARALDPLRHNFKDEMEVVLVRGSRYRRTAVCEMPNPRQEQSLFHVHLEEVVADTPRLQAHPM